jgi:hypothetical protein
MTLLLYKENLISKNIVWWNLLASSGKSRNYELGTRGNCPASAPAHSWPASVAVALPDQKVQKLEKKLKGTKNRQKIVKKLFLFLEKTSKMLCTFQINALLGLPILFFQNKWPSKNQLSGRVGRLKFLRAAIDRGFYSEWSSRNTPNGVCGPKPEVILLDFAAIMLVVRRCNSFETKFKNVKLKSGLQSSDLKCMF